MSAFMTFKFWKYEQYHVNLNEMSACVTFELLENIKKIVMFILQQMPAFVTFKCFQNEHYNAYLIKVSAFLTIKALYE